MDSLMASKLSRNEPVIALGGGVVGDMTGFAAPVIGVVFLSFRFQQHCWHRWTQVWVARLQLIIHMAKI